MGRRRWLGFPEICLGVLVSEAIARTAVGHRGDPVAAELPLMLLTPALFAANMVAARWAESAAIPPVFLAFGR
jgi:hypothetical protein